MSRGRRTQNRVGFRVGRGRAQRGRGGRKRRGGGRKRATAYVRALGLEGVLHGLHATPRHFLPQDLHRLL
eukprot:2506857-Pyramimonas_sp.AAC.1